MRGIPLARTDGPALNLWKTQCAEKTKPFGRPNAAFRRSRAATGAAYLSALSDWIEREYLIDVYEMKREFSCVDVRDRNRIGIWLRDHLFLSTNDVCRIGNICLKTVYRWRQAAGLPRARCRRPPGWRRRSVVPTPPPDWGDGWLAEQYAAGRGLRTIARAVGRSYTAVRRRLRRRGVAFRTAREAVRSRHPCCTREWLLVNYVAKELSLTACAAAGGGQQVHADSLAEPARHPGPVGLRAADAALQWPVNVARPEADCSGPNNCPCRRKERQFAGVVAHYPRATVTNLRASFWCPAAWLYPGAY